MKNPEGSRGYRFIYRGSKIKRTSDFPGAMQAEEGGKVLREAHRAVKLFVSSEGETETFLDTQTLREHVGRRAAFQKGWTLPGEREKGAGQKRLSA